MKRLLWALTLALWLAAGFSAAAEAYGTTPEELYPQVLSSEELEQLAIGYIEAALAEGEETRRHVVTAAYVPRPLRVPEGEITCEVATPNGLRYWGNTAVTVNVLVDGVPFRRLTCQFRIHLFDTIVVAARSIQARQTLTESDLRVEEQEIGAASDKYYTDIAEAVGLVSSRRLSPGQPILRTMVKKPQIIKSGDLITIVAHVNGVEVKMEGMALQPGREGEFIRVRNTLSRKVLRVKVIDEATAEATG